MDTQDVYASIVKLMFNVIRDDELKFRLYKSEEYCKLFVALINDLLTLELAEKSNYKDQQWATVFGKATVIITGQKQRLEKKSKNIEQIYKDYSDFLSYTNKNFSKEISTTTTINFTKEEILLDANLTQEKINQFNEADKKSKEKEIEKEKFEKDKIDESNNFSNDNPYLKTLQNNMPTPPMADQRFNPYSKKPKWMFWMRLILGILTIMLSVTLISLMIFGATKTINFKNDSGEIGGWILKNKEKTLSESELISPIDLFSGQWNTITSCILFGIIGGYLGYCFLKKPNSLREKYHISYFYFFLLFIAFWGSVGLFYRYIDLNALKNQWERFFLQNTSDFNSEVFNSWWENIIEIKQLHVLQGIAIAGVSLLGMLTIFSIIVMIIQPHLDKEKIARANIEYQNAIANAMQGKTYEMDPSLFEDEEKIIKKKSKISIWWHKIFKKKKKKEEDN